VILGQETMPLFDWDWVGRNLDTVWQKVFEHLTLTGVALLVGLVISMVIATISFWKPRTYKPIIATTGVLYTIPSLAMFALVAPLVGGIGSRTGTFVIAEVALVSYTLLILVRNMVTGIRNVPEGVRESARGMGYREMERLWKIEFPIALPVILAGVRIATVTVVGLVTVTSLLGWGGLGFFILDGLRRSIIFPTEIIVGVVLSVALAALLDLGLLALGRLLTPWAHLENGD
jgi:osmoprotectant transport system permease protein